MFHDDVAVTKANWTKVTTGFSTVAIQLKGQGMVLVQLAAGPGSATPTTNKGAVLDGVGSNFAVGGLPADTDCWVKSLKDANETVNVLAY